MKNKNVCELFAQGETEGKTQHLFIEGNVIYSYGYHFPLSVRLFGGYVVNSDGYSVTTSKHKTELLRAITSFSSFAELLKAQKEGKEGNILIRDTYFIKRLLENDIKRIEEARHFLTLKALEVKQ